MESPIIAVGEAAERERLSPEAKAVAAAWFGMMRVDGESHLRFAMVENRPTAKAQAALDELYDAGFISRETEWSGAVIYRPLRDCRPFLVPLMRAALEDNGASLDPRMKFPLTEPIPGVGARRGSAGVVDFHHKRT
jgi:hypothetical protein